MANKAGNYNPEFFANEALDQLYTQLGMARRVHRDVEADRNTAGRSRGEVVNLRRPGKFVAKTHVPNEGSERQNVEGQNVQVKLDMHEEVKFGLTDREIAYSGERIIEEHVKPAAFALGDKIDKSLHELGSSIGNRTTLTGAASARFITDPRKVLRNNGVTTNDGMTHYAIDTGMEAEFLNLDIFHRADATGQGANTGSLMSGTLGDRFGVEVFATQNADVPHGPMSSTLTASDGTGDSAGAVKAATDANSATVTVDGLTDGQTVQAGDTFTIAGDEEVYTITAATAVAGGEVTLTIYPELRRSAVEDAVVLFDLLTATEEADHISNLMFHRYALALCFAPLPNTGDGKGAEIATVIDDESGIALRARMWYDGDTSTNLVALDALWGTQVLDGRKALVVNRATTIAPV